MRNRMPILAVALGIAAGPAGAAASTIRFSATFEAERTVEWKQPQGVNLIDCRGRHYWGAHGDDHTTIKTRGTFKVIVIAGRGGLLWQFGNPPSISNPTSFGVEAHGESTRTYNQESGTTGGWCGGGDTDPQPKNDCGTRLAVYDVLFAGSAASVSWSATFAHRTNEKFDFYNCTLIVPDGMYAGSFPNLVGKVDRAAVLGPRKKPIVIRASKKYGPTDTPVPNFGVTRTSSGSASWKLTLRRTR